MYTFISVGIFGQPDFEHAPDFLELESSDHLQLRKYLEKQSSAPLCIALLEVGSPLAHGGSAAGVDVQTRKGNG